MTFNPQQPKPNLYELDQVIIKGWKDNNIFQRSISERPEDQPYRFYDGPPFITGLPHYGHLAASIAKDAIPRFWTMKGKRVERVRGWDCHGIPIEQKVQSKLGLESNLDIEKVGIDRFIEECYTYTRSVSADWDYYIENIGRRVDMDNAYRTMDNDYMESVWRVFKTLWEKKLIYKGKRVSMYSTKLETPISSFEVAMDDTYNDVNDPTVTVMFDLSANGDQWKDTYALAWTTTPWTIPLNIALAVNKELTYAKVISDASTFIVAEKRVEEIFKGRVFEVTETFTGETLIGLSYKPPFDYLYGKTNNDKDHKIYHADFITDEDGTGIAHEAPEFGDVDFQLAQQIGLTITEAMDSSGHYTTTVSDHVGLFYRDANPIMIEKMQSLGRLFAKGSITHRVAFCPRSNTPLVYKAQDSWFINIQSLKPKLIEKNEEINWYPNHFKHGRFLKSIESAPDWGISRTRYWGTPMPVYVDETGKDIIIIGSREELYELSKEGSKNITKHIFVRHGRIDNNDKHLSDAHGDCELNELGIQQAEQLVEDLQNATKNNEYIVVVSPLIRTFQTALPFLRTYLTEAQIKEITEKYMTIFNKNVDLRKNDKMIKHFEDENNDFLYELGYGVYVDERIGEVTFASKHHNLFVGDTKYNPTWSEEPVNEDSESIFQVDRRVNNYISNISEKFAGKVILSFSHSMTIRVMNKLFNDFDFDKLWRKRTPKNVSIYTNFYSNARKSNLDLHRPYIDDVRLMKDGKRYNRIPEVLDCRVESASMPYAQVHYPFENKEKFEGQFPADYIVEYTGQIRAWFYVMHVLGVALFDTPAFRNVNVTGVLAGNDGRKMSKSYGNYPDPRESFENFGGDAIRMFMLTSPLFAGGDPTTSDEYFAEALRSNILPLWNAFYFFTTYANIDKREPTEEYDISKVSHPLDKFLYAKVQELITTVDEGMQGYDLMRSSRALGGFLDDLTNWYIRRSRRRFWKDEMDQDKKDAYATLYYALVNLCQVAAPFMPFVTEYIYKELTGKESVHLTYWPEAHLQESDKALIVKTKQAQEIISIVLGARSRKNIRVRQPLQTITIGVEVDNYFKDIIADECNVKDVKIDTSINSLVTKICKPDGKYVGETFGAKTKEIFGAAKSGDFTENADGSIIVAGETLPAGTFEISYVKTDASQDIDVDNGIVVKVDRTITPELELEGYARDLVRFVQDGRKEADYHLADRIQLSITGDHIALSLVEKFREYIQDETLSTIVEVNDKPDLSKEVEIGGQSVIFSIQR